MFARYGQKQQIGGTSSPARNSDQGWNRGQGVVASHYAASDQGWNRGPVWSRFQQQPAPQVQPLAAAPMPVNPSMPQYQQPRPEPQTPRMSIVQALMRRGFSNS